MCYTLSGTRPNANKFIIVADSLLGNGNLYQVDITSGKMNQLLPPGMTSNPAALAYDLTAEFVYWTDIDDRTINQYSVLNNSRTVIYRDKSSQ